MLFVGLNPMIFELNNIFTYSFVDGGIVGTWNQSKTREEYFSH